jgi:hypothetical protein
MLAYPHDFVLALPSTFYRKAGTLVALALSGIEGASSVLLTPYRMSTFSEFVSAMLCSRVDLTHLLGRHLIL